MHAHKFLLAAAMAALIAPSALAQEGVISMMESPLGEILTDAAGMTLYTFDKDEPGVSNCNDGCAAKWPPLYAEAGAVAEGEYSIVARADGSMQWAYDGWPLYYWAGDVAPGDTAGDGVGGVWHVVVAGAM